jgi:hypothetical protein
MENVNLYLFTEQQGDIKALIVANTIEIAVAKMQEFTNERNEAEDFFQSIELVPSRSGIGDWEVNVYENYKLDTAGEVLIKDQIAFRYEVFELPFSFNRVYGAIGIF